MKDEQGTRHFVTDGKRLGAAWSRRMLLAGLGAAAAAPAFASAPSVLRGAGAYRALNIAVSRTGEKVNTVYWVDGEYIPEAVEAISYVLRDWREDAVKPIAHATLDVLAATHRMLDCTEPYDVISGYRTPKTNAMLRRQSGGVAKKSYHIKAMAVDLRLASRSVHQIAEAGLSLGAGGVGRYSRSNFVHLDSGPARSWGR